MGYATLHKPVTTRANSLREVCRLCGLLRPRFTLACCVHMFVVWHIKVVLSPVDCNYCRKGVLCLDEFTLVECWTDDPTWIKMMVARDPHVMLSWPFEEPLRPSYEFALGSRRSDRASEPQSLST